jgi:hypothetical protein
MIQNKKLFYSLSILSGVTIGVMINFFSKGQRVKRLSKLTIDVQEKGNNNGWGSERFTEMMKSVGWQNTQHWCMYYVKAIYTYSLPKLKDGISELSGLVSNNWSRAKNGKLSIFKAVTTKPIVGDIAIWLRGDGTGHTGIVTKVRGDKMMITEGNANYINAPKNPNDSVVVNEHDNSIGSYHQKGSKLKLAGFLRLK